MPEFINMDPKGSKAGSGLTLRKESLSLSKDFKGTLGVNRIGSTSRLPSFKGPRDLTFSTASNVQPQITRPKKTFVPNIPVRREKGDSRVIESKSEKSAKKTPNKPRQGDYNRGHGRRKEFIQTRGALFGEGIAAAPLKRSTNSYGGHDGGRGSGGSKIGEMQKPVLNTEAAYNIDKDLEDKRLKEILRDDFIDDPNDVIAIDTLPVQLPMIARADSSQRGGELDIAKIKDKWKRRESLDASDCWLGGRFPPQIGIKIKQEPDEENGKILDDKVNGLIHGGPALVQPEEAFEDSVACLLSKSHSDVMFFQLPSCLPGHPPEVKLESNSSASSSQSLNSKEPNLGAGPQSQRNPLCTLDTLPEGQIGSLKVYESGKVELCIGSYNMELNRGTPVGFLQDVVRMEVDSEQKTGSMVVLGHIKERLVCTPDFQGLTKNMRTS